ncbi:tRNA(Arg) A34 adenosine deaminase TadA [Bradyrhizobium sp. LA6.1]
MNDDNKVNRRDFIATTTAVAGALGAAAVSAPASAQSLLAPPPGFDTQQPLVDNWNRQLGDLVDVTTGLRHDAPELGDPAMRDRHKIFCYLLMKLIVRFWNGNKKGPLGTYPLRQAQLDRPQLPEKPQRYRGEMMANPGGLRVNWDRYLGHNIACIAVDGNGEIIDFDFNHNDFFRSSAEHAESRMVRRLFSLTDVFDGWKTGKKLSDKPHLASLNDVTLYTSLESCAQCSGVMSLAGVRQIVYLQNDFTAYKIGNLMYNLANRTPGVDSRGNAIMDWQGKPVPSLPGAPIPIAGSEIQLDEFEKLNDANLAFSKNIIAAKATNDKDPTIVSGAFFIPDNGKPDFSPSITSFLCTDPALKIFQDGAAKFDVMNLDPVSRDWKFPNRPDNKDILTNQECLDKARAFFIYADTEGYRGSPHKL